MVYTVSCERIFFVVESHKYDVEGIYEIDSENRRDGGDFPASNDRECRYHEGDEHGSGFAEQYARFHIVYPSDEYRRDKYDQARKYESGIHLRRGSRVHEIELERQNSHDEKRDERESGGQAWDPI